jgi:hypothetical protein
MRKVSELIGVARFVLDRYSDRMDACNREPILARSLLLAGAAAMFLFLSGCEGMMQAACETALESAQPSDKRERVEFWASVPRDLRPMGYCQADRDLAR